MTTSVISDEKGVLIIDDSENFCRLLGKSFSELGYRVWINSDFDVAPVCSVAHVQLIVTEQKLARHNVFDMLAMLRDGAPQARIAIVTAHPSVACAVKAIRLGCDAYMAKPVTAASLLESLESETDPNVSSEAMKQWPSLDRTIWEYLNHAYVAAGSMSEAARRLRVDRRSLRRMLAKHPPTY